MSHPKKTLNMFQMFEFIKKSQQLQSAYYLNGNYPKHKFLNTFITLISEFVFRVTDMSRPLTHLCFWVSFGFFVVLALKKQIAKYLSRLAYLRQINMQISMATSVDTTH